VTLTPAMRANNLNSMWMTIISQHCTIVSNCHALLAAIGQERNTRVRGATMSSSESRVEKKAWQRRFTRPTRDKSIKIVQALYQVARSKSPQLTTKTDHSIETRQVRK
jgi:hypothetical protein